MKMCLRKYVGFTLLWICLLANALSTVQAGIKMGGDFTLLDQNNQRFELQQLRGHVVLLFFGYTSCPDVCPAGLTAIAQVLTAFEETDSPVKGLFISVDPERDKPQILKQYTAHFSDQLQGLTGSKQQIDRVTQQYQANYRISRNEKNRITVDHSSNLYVLDKKGEINTIVPFGMTAGHVIDTIQRLLEQ
jgi:protein SCO1/2